MSGTISRTLNTRRGLWGLRFNVFPWQNFCALSNPTDYIGSSVSGAIRTKNCKGGASLTLIQRNFNELVEKRSDFNVKST
jgi:hypothetical protein